MTTCRLSPRAPGNCPGQSTGIENHTQGVQTGRHTHPSWILPLSGAGTCAGVRPSVTGEAGNPGISGAGPWLACGSSGYTAGPWLPGLLPLSKDCCDPALAVAQHA